MNDKVAVTKPVNALFAAAKEIDSISLRASEAFGGAESFEKELTVAQAVVDLRAALTPEVMAPIMALMNTPLGFKTDQDPNKPSANNPQPKPYSVEQVREFFIESRFRGFHIVGNECNIIAGNFYGCAAGFERLVKKNPGVSNFKDFYEVPRMVSDKGAVIKCKAEWNQNGQPQTLEREFAIRVNAGMGADAIGGKAKRKLFAAVHGRLTGVVTPEGDEADMAAIEVKADVKADASVLFGGQSRSKTEPKDEAKPPADDVPMGGKTPLNTAGAEIISTAQADLASFMAASGVSFDDFRSFVQTKNIAKNTDSWASFDEVPAAVCAACQAQPKAMAELIRKFGNLQPK